MKTFDQLTKQQREDAVDFAAYELMDHVAQGTIELTLVDPASQKRLEKILSDARKAESTRLVKLYLINDKPIKTEIYRLAMAAASGSQYDDNGDAVTGVTNGEIAEHIATELPRGTGNPRHS